MAPFLRPRRPIAPPRSPRRRLAFGPVELLEVRTLLSGATADGYIGSIAPLTSPRAEKGDWTVMVYITATDLAENGRPNIVEMEKAAAKLPGSVKIVVLYDQWANVDEAGNSRNVVPPGSKNAWKNEPGALTYATGSGTQAAWSTAGVAVVSPHAPGDGAEITSTFTISTSEVNTGDPAILQNFIAYASMAAPADHYALVMWDHGGGVAAFNVDSFDVLPKDELTTNELVAALEAARERGVKFDLVGFDECLMSTAEVAYALRDLTPVVVASEETEDGPGWDYSTALDALVTPRTATARDLALSIVKSYEGRYSEKEAKRSAFATDNSDTLAAIDTGRIAALASALRSFVTSTAEARSGDWSAILAAYRRTPFFGGKFTDTYRDLGRLMTSIAAATPSAAIRVAAQGVASALESAVFARTADQRQAAGLSIALPPRSSAVDQPYVSQIDASGFLDATDWTLFQARFHEAAAQTRALAGGEANWAYNDNGSNTALGLGTLAGKRLRVPAITIEPGATAWYKFSTSTTGARGDAIRVARFAGSNRLQLKVVAASKPDETLSQGVGAVSLRGLAAGDYLLAVSVPSRQPAARFGLSVRAPSASWTPTNAPRNNDSRGEAADLGTVYNSLLVASQSRSSAGRESWYAFDTPRSAEPYDATVTLITDGRPMTLTLLDDDGAVLKRNRGIRDAQVTYAVPGGGESYYLKVDGASGAFSLFFGDHPIA